MFDWLKRLFGGGPPPRPDPLALLASYDPRDHDTAKEELRARGREALPDLLEVLVGPRPEAALVAAELLGELRAEEGVGPLLRALKFGDRKLQVAARRALERCGSVAVPALREAIGEDNAWVRGQVVEVLAAIKKAASAET